MCLRKCTCFFTFLTPQMSIHTGDNGTIDGQGSIWWDWFQKETLGYTRPHLVEFINSTAVVISNVTFLNSPFWTIHPVYCRFVLCKRIDLHLSSCLLYFYFPLQNCAQAWSFYELGGELRLFFWMNSQVIVQNVTILAPLDSPNTDGIDPGEFSCWSWKLFMICVFDRGQALYLYCIEGT